jgi:flavin reductase (DIM6/NTAB) family NADH-FMN oxidoreductase RutF
MKTIHAAELDAMELRSRVQLATSLPGVKPVVLVGTRGATGVTNLAPFSSVVHLGSSPLLLGMVTRPDVVERHTLANLSWSRCWTLNHLHPGLVRAAHQCSARYPAHVSEFAATGLVEHYEPGFAAPFVAESRFRVGLELAEIVDIASNGTKLIVGRVKLVQLPEERLRPDGSVDLEGLEAVASTALDTYFGVTGSLRLPYAKVPEAPGDA